MKKSRYLLILAGCMLCISGCQAVAGHVAGQALKSVLNKEEANKKDKDAAEREKAERSVDEQENGSSETEERGSDAEVIQEEAPQMELSLQKIYANEYFMQEKVMDITYDTLMVIGEEYPELSAALDKVQQKAKEDAEEWKQYHLQYVQEAASESYFYPYEYTQETQLKRADAQVVSFVSQYYEYTGGAHGMTYYQSECFDTATGKEVSLEDVITDLPRLAQAVIEELNKEYSTDYGDYRETVKRQIIPGSPDGYPATWTLDAEGIVFYFDSYELGAYAMGTPQVIVPYARYPELFREEYCRMPEKYVLRVSGSGCQYIDVNGDGEQEEIYVNAYSPQGYYEEEIYISINETQTTMQSSGWFNQAFLICRKDSPVYLYVCVNEAGDFGCIHIFRIEGENAVYVGDASGNLYEVLLNPSRFKVYDRLDALGSFEGYQYCHVGSNGFPEPEEDSYTILLYGGDEERFLTTKIPVPVWMLSADGTPSSAPEQLPAGTKLYFRRTDNQSYVEMELEDGRRCQVRGDFSGWPKTINGINEDECFDGIMYAG